MMKKNSFLREFAVIFIFVTLAQIMFGYLFPSQENKKARSEETVVSQRLHDIPLVMKNEGLKKKSFEIYNTPTQSLKFDNETGDLVSLTLQDEWEHPDKKNRVSTLFENGIDKQCIQDNLIEYSEESGTYIKRKPLTVHISISDQLAVISRKYPGYNEHIEYSFSPNEPFVLNKVVTVSLAEDLSVHSPENIYLNFYTEIKNSNNALIKGTEQGLRMFQGVAFHTDSIKYKKVPFSKFEQINKPQGITEKAQPNSWIAVTQRYFSTAFKAAYPGTIYTAYQETDDTATIGLLSETLELSRDQPSLTLSSKIYSGPENKELLAKFDSSLPYVIDFGFFWIICDLLLSSLTFIHARFDNWGLAIITLTVLIRSALFFFSKKQQHITSKIAQLQPQQEALRLRFSENEVEFQQALWKLYQKEGINPVTLLLISILNPLVQLPIFFAFYSLLMESVTLRQATFLYLTDLSIPDPFYILPVALLVVSVLQQKTGPKIQNAEMATMMQFMPYVFFAVSLTFPAGLLIYWLTTNVFSLVQQFILRTSGTD